MIRTQARIEAQLKRVSSSSIANAVGTGSVPAVTPANQAQKSPRSSPSRVRGASPRSPRRKRCRADIWLVLSLIGWQGIDMSVSLPSLWIYIQYLGGTKSVYGMAGAIANAVGFAAAPLFGWLADRASSKQVIILALIVQTLGGLVYALAALCHHPPNHDYDLPGDHDNGRHHTPADPDSSSSGDGGGSITYTGPYVVVAARFLIGADLTSAVCRVVSVPTVMAFFTHSWAVCCAGLASGSGATARAYLTRNSDAASKTANLGLAAVSWRLGLVIGPVVNLGIVAVPNGRWFGLPFTNLTW
eukprot:COSAG02_NODE_1720_length_11195_cov_7.064978_7_plen_301_part_00